MNETIIGSHVRGWFHHGNSTERPRCRSEKNSQHEVAPQLPIQTSDVTSRMHGPAMTSETKRAESTSQGPKSAANDWEHRPKRHRPHPTARAAPRGCTVDSLEHHATLLAPKSHFDAVQTDTRCCTRTHPQLTSGRDTLWLSRRFILYRISYIISYSFYRIIRIAYCSISFRTSLRIQTVSNVSHNLYRIYRIPIYRIFRIAYRILIVYRTYPNVSNNSYRISYHAYHIVHRTAYRIIHIAYRIVHIISYIYRRVYRITQIVIHRILSDWLSHNTTFYRIVP